jgi:hypothetical protein
MQGSQTRRHHAVRTVDLRGCPAPMSPSATTARLSRRNRRCAGAWCPGGRCRGPWPAGAIHPAPADAPRHFARPAVAADYKPVIGLPARDRPRDPHPAAEPDVEHLVVHGHDLAQQAFSGVARSLTRTDLGLIDVQSQPYVECVLHRLIGASSSCANAAAHFWIGTSQKPSDYWAKGEARMASQKFGRR